MSRAQEVIRRKADRRPQRRVVLVGVVVLLVGLPLVVSVLEGFLVSRELATALPWIRGMVARTLALWAMACAKPTSTSMSRCACGAFGHLAR